MIGGPYKWVRGRSPRPFVARGLTFTAPVIWYLNSDSRLSLTRFCLSSIVNQVATTGPFSTARRGAFPETTFIELTHTAIDFLAKSANILESAVDLSDSSSVDKFLGFCHTLTHPYAHSFTAFGLTLLWLLCFACSLASPLQPAPGEITS